MQTIQLTAQVDDRGVLRVQMPDGLKNSTVDATIVFITTENNSTDLMNKSNSLSLGNSTADDRTSWIELVQSLSGAWEEDFPTLAKIRAQLEKQGTPIGPMDILIAGTAIALQATLVTHNVREFSRIPGLSIADWY